MRKTIEKNSIFAHFLLNRTFSWHHSFEIFEFSNCQKFGRLLFEFSKHFKNPSSNFEFCLVRYVKQYLDAYYFWGNRALQSISVNFRSLSGFDISEGFNIGRSCMFLSKRLAAKIPKILLLCFPANSSYTRNQVVQREEAIGTRLASSPVKDCKPIAF